MQRSRETPDADAATDAAGCARAVMEATPPITWFMRREMRRRRGSLSLPRFRTLVRVNQGEAGVSRIAEHLGTSVPTASRIVSGLVRGGLLTRRAATDTDRRRVELALTPRGRAALDAARAGTLERLAAELGRLSADERSSVVGAMRLLRGLFAPLAIAPAADAADAGTTTKERRPARGQARAMTTTEASDGR